MNNTTPINWPLELSNRSIEIEHLKAAVVALEKELDRSVDLLSSLRDVCERCAMLSASLKNADAEVERLKDELRRGSIAFVHEESEALKIETQLRELREAYDLLHKRIEAYDETHAYLQELREAAETCVDNAHSRQDDCYHVYAPFVDSLRVVLEKLK